MKEIAIKVYFYVTSGQSVIDKFRYLIMGILALYAVLHLTSMWFLPVMLVAAVPMLLILGYVNVHYISKVQERLSVQHGTHYAIKQFELIEKQTHLLEEILSEVKTKDTYPLDK